MLRPQLRLCRMAWVRGEGRESNKATNIYEIGHNNMKRTNLHTCTHDCTGMETTKYNGYNHCATKPVHRRSDDNVTKHKTQLLNTGSTKLQENNASARSVDRNSKTIVASTPIYIIIIIIVEEKRAYGYELRVTLHHCNMILYTVRKCNN